MATNRPDDGKALIARLADGKEEAFAELYDRFGARLYHAALAIGGDRQEAEDVVQELFASLAQAGDKIRNVESLPAYLFVSLRRAARRANARRNGRPLTYAGDGISDFAASEARNGVLDTELRLERAVDALPDKLREVIALKIEGELTFAEIAEVLDINPNTAASRYRYALKKLKATLGEIRRHDN